MEVKNVSFRPVSAGRSGDVIVSLFVFGFTSLREVLPLSALVPSRFLRRLCTYPFSVLFLIEFFLRFLTVRDGVMRPSSPEGFTQFWIRSPCNLIKRIALVGSDVNPSVS